MAAICGLEQIPKDKRNPLALTTQGVGELIGSFGSIWHPRFYHRRRVGLLPMMVVLVWHMDWVIVFMTLRDRSLSQ